jgi:hypothetical protein
MAFRLPNRRNAIAGRSVAKRRSRWPAGSEVQTKLARSGSTSPCNTSWTPSSVVRNSWRLPPRHRNARSFKRFSQVVAISSCPNSSRNSSADTPARQAFNVFSCQIVKIWRQSSSVKATKLTSEGPIRYLTTQMLSYNLMAPTQLYIL